MERVSTCMLPQHTQGGNDPQTEADRKAQRCIVNSLARKFPAMTIYGEEVN